MDNAAIVLNVYEIIYPDFVDDHPDYTVIRTAETAGKAKYNEYLTVSDAYEMTYLEYLKLIRIRKVGSSAPKRGEEPFRAPERIENANRLIREIGSRGRGFLYYKRADRYSAFHWAGGRLWYTDHYSGIPMIMDPGQEGKTKDQQRAFSSGGTLWGLMQDFRDYIFGDDDANHNNGYGGLYCPHWAYPEEDMQAIRALAVELGYLRERVKA
ncbi:hypothetical protein ACFSR7_15450 [Cohnella sp. GCM10020058]|uniref:hypothetical protein n=1 Tax=Cohnella sp. GCM10020058 TaxID=3317330 RepID=UPI00363B0317